LLVQRQQDGKIHKNTDTLFAVGKHQNIHDAFHIHQLGHHKQQQIVRSRGKRSILRVFAFTILILGGWTFCLTFLHDLHSANEQNHLLNFVNGIVYVSLTGLIVFMLYFLIE
jgi:hypothetical protein